MILELKFNQNFKKELYQKILNSNKLQFTIRMYKNSLYINAKDLEYVDKVFDRNCLKYKIK
jgi:hypothetical protein